MVRYLITLDDSDPSLLQLVRDNVRVTPPKLEVVERYLYPCELAQIIYSRLPVDTGKGEAADYHVSKRFETIRFTMPTERADKSN